jgi:hypothetical protein
MLSKSHRERLKPYVFTNLKLFPQKFRLEVSNNLFIEYFKSLSNTKLRDNIIKNEGSWNSEEELNGFSSGLQNIKLFAKRIFFAELSRAGYYLFPLISDMRNLTILKLRSSIVPYSSFAKLGETLNNLIDIDLCSVIFIKSNTENSSSSNFIFPRNLKCLNVWGCEEITIQLALNPCEILFNKSYLDARVTYSLPNTPVPSLKTLSFYPHSPQDTSLSDFLSINSELDSLKTILFNSAWVNNITTLKSLEIIKLSYLNTPGHIAKLESLKKLKISSVTADYYENIKNFCSLCDKLEYLGLRLIGYECVQQFMDALVIPVIYNLKELKTLHLHFETIINGTLNIVDDFNVESLIIKTKVYNILNICFEECSNLKKIKFELFSESYDLQMLKDKFSSYTNWKFKFEEESICGVKINKI